MEPATLERRYGLTFEQDHDDLDHFELAAIALTEGQQLWLMRYRDAPSRGTVVYADSDVDPLVARDDLLAVLDLPIEELS